MLRSWSRIVLVVLLALVVAACGAGAGGGGGNGGGDDTGGGGDGGGDGGGGGTVGSALVGFVTLSESISVGFGNTRDVDVDAVFFATSQAVVDAFVAAGPSPAVGTCFVTTSSSPIDFDDGFEVPTVPPDVDGTLAFVDAGEELTLAAGSTAYTVLGRRSFGSVIVYEDAFDDDEDAPAPPAGLVLTVPGATGGFPAGTVAIADVAAMSLTSPAVTGDPLLPSIPVTADTVFTWAPPPAGAPNSHVSLFASQVSVDPGSFQAFYRYVECTAADNGSFEFPAATKTALGASFDGNLIEFKRVAREVKVVAGANVIVEVERGSFSPSFF